MRVSVVAALVVFGASLVAVAEPAHEWAVDLPAGWVNDDAMAAQARKEAGNPGFLRDVFAWHAPGDMSGLLLLQAGVFDTHEKSEVREFDRGVMKPVADAGAKIVDTQPLHDSGNVMIAESTIEMANGVHARWQRRYIASSDGMHLVVAMCFGQDSKLACGPTLDKMRFAVASTTKFDTSIEDDMSPAERTGYQIGKVVGALAVIGVAVWLLSRRKKSA